MTPRGFRGHRWPERLYGHEIGVAGATTGTHRRTVNGPGKAWREFSFYTVRASSSADDLRRYVAPVNTNQFRHWTICSLKSCSTRLSPVCWCMYSRPR